MPESRFRFAGPCHGDTCAQWSGSRCQVIDRVADEVAAHNILPAEGSPSCSIRQQCRWFAQVGVDACRVCPLVVTTLPSAPAQTDA
jgi:hypothetical protein